MKKRMLRSLEAFIYGDGYTSGLWSDDSSMVLASLDSFPYLNGYSLMKRLDNWWRRGDYTPRGYAFDIDPTTLLALERFERGVHPLACGSKLAESNSPAGLMRTWPLAIYAMRSFKLKTEKYKALNFVSSLVACSHGHGLSLIISSLYSELLWQIMVEPTMEEFGRVLTGLYAPYREDPLWAEIETRLGTPLVENHVVDLFFSAMEIIGGSQSFEDSLEKSLAWGAKADSRTALVASITGLIFDDRPENFSDIYNKKEIRDLALEAWLSIQ